MKKKYFLLIISICTCSIAFGQWVALNSGTSRALNTVYFPSINTGYILPYNGPLLRTTNGGSTWDSLNSIALFGGELFGNNVWFVDDSNGFISTHSTSGIKLYKTVNMGNTWTNVIPNDSIYGILKVQFINKQRGFIYSNSAFDDRFWQTSNGGVKWTEQTLGFSLGSGTSSLPTMYFVNDSTGFLAGGDGSFMYKGTIARTTDAGKTWNLKFLTAGTVVNSIHFPKQDTGYFISRGGSIYRTYSEGLSWDSISKLNSTTTTSEIFFLNGTTGYVISGSKIYKTTDGAVTWNQQNSRGVRNLTNLFFTSSGTGYIVGDSGTILKITNGGTTGIEAGYTFTPEIKIYPNPASNELFVQSKDELRGGEITIFNGSGKLILKQNFINFSSTTFDLSGYSNGIYFLQIKREDKLFIQKFIRQ